MWFKEAAPTITYTAGILSGSNLQYWIIGYQSTVWEMILQRSFYQNNVKMKENIELNCSWLKNHLRVIKQNTQYAVKGHWVVQLLPKFAQGAFSTCWIRNQIFSETIPGIQAGKFLVELGWRFSLKARVVFFWKYVFCHVRCKTLYLNNTGKKSQLCLHNWNTSVLGQQSKQYYLRFLRFLVYSVSNKECF